MKSPMEEHPLDRALSGGGFPSLGTALMHTDAALSNQGRAGDPHPSASSWSLMGLLGNAGDAKPGQLHALPLHESSSSRGF